MKKTYENIKVEILDYQTKDVMSVSSPEDNELPPIFITGNGSSF